MTKKLKDVIRRVLRAATNTPHWFDLNDAEKLNGLIGDAYARGVLAGARDAAKRRRESSTWSDREDAS